jgi:F-type H+-transporting ATPase subunit b
MVKRTIVAASLLLAFATPAAAAEGGLEIFPDLVKILAEGGNPLGSHFLQLIALFLLLIVPVNRFVLTPLLGVLEERSARIEGARKRASDVGTQADAALARYSAAVEVARKQAGELRKEALEGARGDQVRILADARRTAEAEVAGARGSMASALAEARGVLRAESEGLAREAAARVLGRPLS